MFLGRRPRETGGQIGDRRDNQVNTRHRILRADLNLATRKRREITQTKHELMSDLPASLLFFVLGFAVVRRNRTGGTGAARSEPVIPDRGMR